MILDNLLLFTGTSNGAAAGITASAYADLPTTGTQVASNIIDLGVRSGVPSSANGGGARDIGIGDDPAMKLSAIVTTAITGGTSLALDLSGAPDNGSGLEGAYTVMWQSPAAVAEASLIAGAQIANIDVPRTVQGQVLPRFLRLRFISVGTHSAGAIQCQIVLDRDDQIYGTTYGGYPVGVTVAN
jgi:hypothetical protein